MLSRLGFLTIIVPDLPLRSTRMILIYNLSGLLVGAAGALVGVMLLALSGRLGVGVLGMAIVWMVLGFAWRYWKTPEGVPRRYPAVFFIPLPFLAMGLMPLAALIFLVEQLGDPLTQGAHAASGQDDPRITQLKEDERSLNASRHGGDAALSESLAGALAATLTEDAKADQYHVFTRVSPDNLLVLVKAPNLKSYKPNAREELIRVIVAFLAGQDRVKDKKVYVGIKGKIAFGAIRVPPDRTETGSVLSETPLYDFYGPGASVPEGPNPAVFTGYEKPSGGSARPAGGD